MRSAFTIIGLLVVVTIIAILMAILIPVLGSAKTAAYQTVCVSNLRQLAMAIQMYRSDYDGEERYGNIYDMGLPPPRGRGMRFYLRLPKSFGRCDGASVPFQAAPTFFGPTYLAQEPERKTGNVYWQDYAIQMQDRALIFLDLWHNPRSVPLGDPFVTKKVLAIRLSGELTVRQMKGDPYDFQWWE